MSDESPEYEQDETAAPDEHAAPQTSARVDAFLSSGTSMDGESHERTIEQTHRKPRIALGIMLVLAGAGLFWFEHQEKARNEAILAMPDGHALVIESGLDGGETHNYMIGFTLGPDRVRHYANVKAGDVELTPSGQLIAVKIDPRNPRKPHLTSYVQDRHDSALPLSMPVLAVGGMFLLSLLLL